MLRSLVLKIFSNLYKKSNGRVYLFDLNKECKINYKLFFNKDNALVNLIKEDNFATISDKDPSTPLIIVNKKQQIEEQIDEKDILKLKNDTICNLVGIYTRVVIEDCGNITPISSLKKIIEDRLSLDITSEQFMYSLVKNNFELELIDELLYVGLSKNKQSRNEIIIKKLVSDKENITYEDIKYISSKIGESEIKIAAILANRDYKFKLKNSDFGGDFIKTKDEISEKIDESIKNLMMPISSEKLLEIYNDKIKLMNGNEAELTDKYFSREYEIGNYILINSGHRPSLHYLLNISDHNTDFSFVKAIMVVGNFNYKKKFNLDELK